jgi:hypothetical protein
VSTRSHAGSVPRHLSRGPCGKSSPLFKCQGSRRELEPRARAPSTGRATFGLYRSRADPSRRAGHRRRDGGVYRGRRRFS